MLYAAQAYPVYFRTHSEAFPDTFRQASFRRHTKFLYQPLDTPFVRISHALSSGRGCSTLLQLFLCAIDNFRCISYMCSTSLSSQFDSLFASHLRPSITIYVLCGLVCFLSRPQYLSARIHPLASFNFQVLNIYSSLLPSLPSTT